MAKFKRNHQSQGSKGGIIVKVGLFAGILAAMFWAFQKFSGDTSTAITESGYEVPTAEDYRTQELHFLPTSTTGEVVYHKYYTLSYSEKDEQAEWVAYELTEEQLEQEWVEREDDFKPDPNVKTGSSTPEDYRRSGYDRGHLVPAADRSFSTEAIQETFFMSNISPQQHNFNGGIWRELEEVTRTWAKRFNRLYIVSGPVLTQEAKDIIGENQVTVPAAYFKVLLDISEPELKGIGFIIPNEVSYERLKEYAVSIDEVEKMTGLDFFPSLLSNELEEKLEKTIDNSLWPYNEQKYKQRINSWNKY